MRCGRSLLFVSSSLLLVIVVSTLVVAQSSRAPLSNQLNRLPVIQEPHGEMPNDLPQEPQETLFASGAEGVSRKGFAPLVVSAQSTGLIFQAPVSYGSGGRGVASVAVADVNGDGKLDIIVANDCADASSPCDTTGSVGVLLGNGDGTFKAAVSYSSGGYTACCGSTSVAVGDVNGDGKPDIVVSTCDTNMLDCGGSVGVLFGNGNGTFQTAVTYSSGGVYAGFVAIADVNGDGKPDILVVNECDGNENSVCDDGKTTSDVGVLLNNGDGTFQTAVTYETDGAHAGSLAIADVNGDGSPDIIIAVGCVPFGALCNGADVGVLLGNGNGTFQPFVAYEGGDGFSLAVAVGVADLNGDGKILYLQKINWEFCWATAMEPFRRRWTTIQAGVPGL
jgi:hypothetical protein